MERISQIMSIGNLCEPCIKGKHAQLQFNKYKTSNYIKLQLFNIYTVICCLNTTTVKN